MPLRTNIVAVAVLCACLALSAPVEAVAQDIPILYPYGDTLISGQSLLRGQGLISLNGQYTLILQEDGNLVEYYSGSTATWATRTDRRIIDHATLQTDGNFVLYDDQEEARWASNTVAWGSTWNAAYKMVLANDGYINFLVDSQYGNIGNTMQWTTWSRVTVDAASPSAAATEKRL